MLSLVKYMGGLVLCAIMLCAIVLSPTSLSAQAAQAIASSDPINGTLADGDSRLPSGGYYDEYVFEGEEGASVTITLDSTEFDAYLIVRSPAGFETENDDLNDDTTNAGLRLTLDEPGTWKILVTSYDAAETGAYTLTVRL